ncbi:MAG: hypothetical protein ACE5PV_07510 [Candidatus Poribacteria bacterium]
MLLYNFTNHPQDEYIAFFQQHGFDEVTAPMHPEITPDMTEEEIIETIAKALPTDLAGKHFLVQGMSNVCHYAVTLIQRGGGTAYYVLTERLLDENGRFVFLPVALRKYADIGHT